MDKNDNRIIECGGRTSHFIENRLLLCTSERGGLQGLEGEEIWREAHGPASLLYETAPATNRQGCVWKYVLIPDTTSLFKVSHTQSTATSTVLHSASGKKRNTRSRFQKRNPHGSRKRINKTNTASAIFFLNGRHHSVTSYCFSIPVITVSWFFPVISLFFLNKTLHF